MSSSPLAPVLAIALGLALAAPGSAVLAQSRSNEIVVDSPTPLQPGHELKHRTVNFADLNINSEHGAQRLVQRIRGAARRVCMPEPRGGLKDRQNYEACLHGAMTTAVAQLDNAHVTQALSRISTIR
jgi:UrcA family protein